MKEEEKGSESVYRVGESECGIAAVSTDKWRMVKPIALPSDDLAKSSELEMEEERRENG